MTGACYGPLPRRIQEGGCGEIYAFLMALQMAGSGQIATATDCNLVIDVWAQGPDQQLDRVACSEPRKLIFEKGEDLSRSNILLVKNSSPA